MVVLTTTDPQQAAAGTCAESQPQDSRTVMYQPDLVAGPTTKVAVPGVVDSA